MKKPTTNQLLKIDLTKEHGYTRNGRSVEFFNAEPGKEHYRLLAWLSLQFSGVTICEVGTLDGCGTLALSHNPENRVVSFDVRFYDDRAEMPDNAELKLVYDGFMDEVAKCPLIFYDTMHDGVLEREFVEELRKRDYKGLVVFDDIYLNEPMKQFWYTLSGKKEDWTDIGHWSGTGVLKM